MLEKPDIREADIQASLAEAYGLGQVDLTFLPIGADPGTAVYRARIADGASFFVKLRLGGLDPMSVALPTFLSEQGIGEIIAPLATRAGARWAELGAHRLIVYPFVEGEDAYTRPLTDAQWVAFGAAVRRIHAVALPERLARNLQVERFDPRWRERVRMWLGAAETRRFSEPCAESCAALMTARRAAILDLVQRAETLALRLAARALPPVLCHGDLHAGNLHIGADGALHIVDWDAPILAPKERDLMYAGGGQFGNARAPSEEEALFQAGYGRVAIDFDALDYFRFERIVQDIAVECDLLLGSDAGGDDRPQALRWLKSNFAPGGVLEIARRQHESGRRHPKMPFVRRSMDIQTRSTLEALWSDDDDARYKAFLAVIALTDAPVDWAYEVWDDLLAHLRHKNNHIRAIASQVLCNLAKSDPESRMLKDFDAIMAVTGDKMFVTARHTLQALWKVGVAGEQQRALVLDRLARWFKDCVSHKNRTLIRYDIVVDLRQLYDAVKDPRVKEIALALIATEPDVKYQKKYEGVWRKA